LKNIKKTIWELTYKEKENKMKQFMEFKNAGIKIDLETFNVLPLNDTFGDDSDIINLREIPFWELYDIKSVMTYQEEKLFNELLKKATKGE
jgi:hypothetical protein